MWTDIRLIPCLLVISLVLSLSHANPVKAGDPGVKVISQEQMKQIFTEIIMENVPWPRDDLEISNFVVMPATLKVPKGTLEYRVISKIYSQYLGKKAITIAITINGEEHGEIRMSGDLRLYGDVVCTARQLKRHTVLTQDDITMVRRDISMLGTDFVTSRDAAAGMRLKTSMRMGAVLYSNQLEHPPLIQRGDLVTILAHSDQITVTVPGEARDPGAQGELVRVKNLMSRKEIFARVIDPGTVEVEY